MASSGTACTSNVTKSKRLPAFFPLFLSLVLCPVSLSPSVRRSDLGFVLLHTPQVSGEPADHEAFPLPYRRRHRLTQQLQQRVLDVTDTQTARAWINMRATIHASYMNKLRQQKTGRCCYASVSTTGWITNWEKFPQEPKQPCFMSKCLLRLL